MRIPGWRSLRERFRETSRIRAAEISSLLAGLEALPSDSSRLLQLAVQFHALAGMGGTYGFPRISTIGSEAEAAIQRILREGRSPDAADLSRWRLLVAEVLDVLADAKDDEQDDRPVEPASQ